MKFREFSVLLRKNGYRDTQPRRMVLEAMIDMNAPVSPYDIQKHISKEENIISTVTIYRVTELLEKLGLVHRHPCSGKLALCVHPGETGLHGYMHCHDCGSSEEFCSKDLQSAATKHAARKGFKADNPLLEIVGSCKDCTN
jgi:Fe2+ or Zn2+ uptake regulation protein